MKKIGMNTENGKTHLILFGSIVDGGGSGGGSGGGDGGGGGGNNGGGGIDYNACVRSLVTSIADVAVSTALLSSDIQNIDATHRTITYTWVVYASILGGWQFVSRDIGTQENIGGVWQWISLAHQGVTLQGATLTYTLTYSDLQPPRAVVYSTTTAYTELYFQVRLTTYCTGLPVDVEITDKTTHGVAKKVFLTN